MDEFQLEVYKTLFMGATPEARLAILNEFFEKSTQILLTTTKAIDRRKEFDLIYFMRNNLHG